MHSSEETTLDADVVLDYLKDRCHAISSARSVRDDVMFLFIIGMVVNTHD